MSGRVGLLEIVEKDAQDDFSKSEDLDDNGLHDVDGYVEAGCMLSITISGSFDLSTLVFFAFWSFAWDVSGGKC